MKLKKSFYNREFTKLNFMIINKSLISLIVFELTSIILITGSPFQITNNLVQSNGNLSIKNIGQEIYGEEDEDGGGDVLFLSNRNNIR